MLRTATMTAIAPALAAPAFAQQADPQLKQQAETIFSKYLQALNSAYGNGLKNLYSRKAVTITLAALFVIALSACAVTKKSQPEAVTKSGFLQDYSQLKPGDKEQAALIYWNPNAQWGRYNKVLLDPVTLVGPEGKISPEDQARLSKYFHDKFVEELSKNFTLVNRPGPDVMRIRAALTDADAATSGLRTISVVVPQARLLNAGYDAATGSYAFVGSAQGEGEVLDSVTGERLAAAVDRRYGGMSIKNAGVWKWGDAENIMDHWAENMSTKLAERRAAGQASSGSSAK
jgi:uncharacterized protein DUF3313